MVAAEHDPALLIAHLRGLLLRVACDHTGVHHEGLRSVAAHLQRGGLLDNKMVKKLQRVDDAFC
eukprot:11872521-Alexandrium_andersonii.AAC.1